jgi:hypothetical protein
MESGLEQDYLPHEGVRRKSIFRRDQARVTSVTGLLRAPVVNVRLS